MPWIFSKGRSASNRTEIQFFCTESTFFIWPPFYLFISQRRSKRPAVNKKENIRSKLDKTCSGFEKRSSEEPNFGFVDRIFSWLVTVFLKPPWRQSPISLLSESLLNIPWRLKLVGVKFAISIPSDASRCLLVLMLDVCWRYVYPLSQLDRALCDDRS